MMMMMMSLWVALLGLDQVRGILNKITIDTFERLSETLCSIEIESMEMLQRIIALVFDKVSQEPLGDDAVG
jgi:hypothetical protein